MILPYEPNLIDELNIIDYNIEHSINMHKNFVSDYQLMKRIIVVVN
ncbi:Uncharacterised protein [Chlamydia trachomatis]|nr:Uncharacterised protein [Chlamydia trachomatis]